MDDNRKPFTHNASEGSPSPTCDGEGELHAKVLRAEIERMDRTLNQPPEWQPVKAAMKAGADALEECERLRVYKDHHEFVIQQIGIHIGKPISTVGDVLSEIERLQDAEKQMKYEVLEALQIARSTEARLDRLRAFDDRYLTDLARTFGMDGTPHAGDIATVASAKYRAVIKERDRLRAIVEKADQLRDALVEIHPRSDDDCIIDQIVREYDEAVKWEKGRK